jgi:regulator of RNase E activity RraA
MTQTVPVSGVAQVGKERVRVITGLTTHAGESYLCGPALTCACAPEDNLAMHAALYQARHGAGLRWRGHHPVCAVR